MKHLTRITGVLLLGFVYGCESSGISARDPYGQSTAGLVEEFCAQAATQPSATASSLRRPAKLAVAQIGEIQPPQSMIAELQKHSDRFSAVMTIPALSSASGDGSNNQRSYSSYSFRQQLDAYRGVAARMGADYLLLLGGTADTLEDTTPLSVLDLSIVGLFVIPAHWVRGEVNAVAAIIDTHDGQPVSLLTTQASGKSLVPEVQVDSERVKLVQKLRDQAAVKIAQDLLH